MAQESVGSRIEKQGDREGYTVESIGEVRVGILDGNASVASEVTVRGREVEELDTNKGRIDGEARLSSRETDSRQMFDHCLDHCSASLRQSE